MKDRFMAWALVTALMLAGLMYVKWTIIDPVLARVDAARAAIVR